MHVGDAVRQKSLGIVDQFIIFFSVLWVLVHRFLRDFTGEADVTSSSFF